ncbi:asparagine synthase (glutamine-hydrolyzing) [Amycolatopsis rubida]|uniref:asparagine synthase (glutamine-hydrolyzing) n=1 Tax=Amycolatopsis rubida TaxID=112413 RepID=A0A1I5INK9_9PSEU|nr:MULTISPECIES: asparagine synthase (glutamine-hydrolyzing) [Amycolatopsis]MYW91746.1 asparagine synthase (glutamine-hydrolyzing) [Amycolatopsis rubida]NEC56730.1 asparagine synthase (glutamine-hydrolyzing) [Amycolatopsis rubida]OAP20680.1 Asparagine synthetase [glutamine-hydrolyzing] 3 [Amycolatopsis sp. M39]SFO62127.1 asparagine synthase (glutamine-hydrolysing) [Amycolatopsis rubida]
MCGIAGWADFERFPSREPQVLQDMTEAMACRGPDAHGCWFDEHVAFGHRRLSVIDPAGGGQPMTLEHLGRTVLAITYSGEVYNYRELRAELSALGHRFRTASDTEVVLHAYLQWGTAMARRLNGMFAFAIWDARSERLLLVRDRLGIKPLYYCPAGRGLLFGSEAKAILAHPDVAPVVDRDGLRELLAGVKTPEHAIFRGLRELRPGHLLVFDREGKRIQRYWALEAREHPDDLHTTVRTVRALLEDIVERQLVADVPLCTLLSGGLDSSVVTALAARSLAAQGAGPVRSFSVDFAGNERDFAASLVHESPDAPFAAEMARHVAAEHTNLVLGLGELAASSTRAVVPRAHDVPAALLGDAFASLYLLFRAVRERSTVALSGEAADELFGGYPWFHVPELRDADTFPWVAAGYDLLPALSGLLDPGLLADLDVEGYRAQRYAEALAEVPVLPGEDAAARRIREVGYLAVTRFVPMLLDRKDRMSMAVGLEVRVPFCDHRLVDYLFNVPWRMKFFDGKEKSLLRAAAGHLLPEPVANRKKSAYPITHDPGYDAALRAEFARLASSPGTPVHALIDGTATARLGSANGWPSRSGLEFMVQLDSWLADHDLAL